MKKFIYFILIVVVGGLGFLLWNNYKIVPVTAVIAPVVSNQKASSSNVTVATSTPFVENKYFSKLASSTLGGSYITDNNKRALYMYTKDTPGTSVCTGECLKKWPIYGPGMTMSELAKLPPPPVNFSVIQRPDGLVQFTWKNIPLYYFAEDKLPGDAKGHKIGDVWFLIEAK